MVGCVCSWQFESQRGFLDLRLHETGIYSDAILRLAHERLQIEYKFAAGNGQKIITCQSILAEKWRQIFYRLEELLAKTMYQSGGSTIEISSATFRRSLFFEPSANR
jgi:hypothetical protein